MEQWKRVVPPSLMKHPRILLTAEMDPEISQFAWTIFPLLEVMKIQLEADEALDWIALLNENTEVDLINLNDLVRKKSFKPREEALFFGKALKDSDPTIVHHFSSDELLYPDLEAGIFLSRKLVYNLWQTGEPVLQQKNFPNDFNIDPSYEFAKFVYNDGSGVMLENISEMCTKKSAGCITFSRKDYSCVKKSDTSSISEILSRTLIAVKTCQKYHNDRLKAVMDTWGPLVKHLLLVSDAEDPEMGTIVLPDTVNTESGHCNKTLAILEHFNQMEESLDYLVIVDDDTIMSIVRLSQLLSCYDQDDLVMLGQRYGYMAASGEGYSYLTGGAGMIFNRNVVAKMMENSRCACPTPDNPDDMHLGRCAKRTEIPILHSNRMFQARPPDYPASMLSSRSPISFHKHWEISPHKVYKQYFEEIDKNLFDVLKDEL